MKKIAFLAFALALSGSFFIKPVFAEADSLKEISAKQDKIIQMLEELKNEINTVKVRVTQAQ